MIAWKRLCLAAATTLALSACGVIGFDTRTTQGQVSDWLDAGGRDASSNLGADYGSLTHAPDYNSFLAGCEKLRTDVLSAAALEEAHPIPGDLDKKWNATVLHLASAATACLNGDPKTAFSELGKADVINTEVAITSTYLGTS